MAKQRSTWPGKYQGLTETCDTTWGGHLRRSHRGQVCANRFIGYRLNWYGNAHGARLPGLPRDYFVFSRQARTHVAHPASLGTASEMSEGAHGGAGFSP